MKDQAEKLRQIIENLKSQKESTNVSQVTKNEIFNSTPQTDKNITRVITVTSGKGGVGKTNTTVNLGIALSNLGYRVIIIDVDFGLANIDIVCGVTAKYTLADVINDDATIVDALTDGPGKIQFISGGSGIEELVNIDKTKLEKFIKNITLLDSFCDIILIDTGAGLSESVMSFVMSSQEVVVVTTPEPTAITDAYALIKMISNRDKSKKVKILVNRAEDEKEAVEVQNKLTLVSERFLELDVEPLGYIYRDDAVIKAVKQRTPFVLAYPRSTASKSMNEIAQKIIKANDEYNTNTNGIKTFVNKLAGFFNIVNR